MPTSWGCASLSLVADPRDRDYAELIVEDCLGVQPGWQVLVGGNPQARPLLEEVCGAVARRGAYALLRDHACICGTLLAGGARWQPAAGN